MIPLPVIKLKKPFGYLPVFTDVRTGRVSCGKPGTGYAVLFTDPTPAAVATPTPPEKPPWLTRN